MRHRPNWEHPPLSKEIIAGGIWLLGDRPLGWRLPAVFAGTLTLFALMRGMWLASERRFATIVYGLLLIFAFMLFVQAHAAMLDIFMILFIAVALWQCAGAVRQPETGRWRLALAGIGMGLALACKWNVIPPLPLPGLAFLALRWRAGRRRLLLSRRGGPVPGITLVEAAWWLGVVPLLAYALTFIPEPFYAHTPFTHRNFFEVQLYMLQLQQSVRAPHPYESVWWQWALDLRSIWYMWEDIGGARRGIIMLGNPVVLWLGLPATLWCAWAGLFRRRADAGAFAILYAASFGFWIVAAKPIQFFYHYLLPSLFLTGALALACDAAWVRGGRWRWAAVGVPIAAGALFAYFFPILTGAPLPGMHYYRRWMWLPGWV